MGKKVKVGKQRRDKYYRLAKESGFRSRAAFKLIQLNKRFEFLQTSRAVVDLCAAPGGWMQVATQNMPVSSLCIGVDLAPIKPIPNCIALQGDITTEKTRQAIKKELQTWEADTVLHDGAPNVGMNWYHDAFQQNCLTLSALKLATQILKRGGTFVTKIFRSNDYHCLITVFEKLFKKVHVWKPAASRLESAEIFVVCEKFAKPSKVDPDLLDPKKVFLAPDLEPSKPNGQKLLMTVKEKKAKAEGYADGEFSFQNAVTATHFIDTPNYIEVLGSASSIELDEDMWKTAEETTEEIRECLKDIKVLGPRDLRVLLKWRKAMIKHRSNVMKSEGGDDEGEEGEGEMEVEENPDDVEDKEMAKLDEAIARATAEEKAALKKKKKKMLKEKAKTLLRKQLKMVHEGDVVDLPDQPDLFSLKNIRKMKELATVVGRDGVDTPTVEGEEEEMEEGEEGLGEGEWETRGREGEEEEEEEEENELLHTDEYGMTKEERSLSRADKWFNKEEMADLLDVGDSDDELDAVEKHLESTAKRQTKNLHADTVTFGDDEGKKQKRKKDKEDEDEEFDKMDTDEVNKSAFDEEEDVSSDEEYEDEDKRAAKRPSEEKPTKASSKDKAKKRRLTPEQLALGEEMIYSSKRRRELEEYGWNRFMNNDEELPDWFVEDEKKHYKKNLPVTKAQVAAYKERLKEINTRPIKKVAEAKARKQRRVAVRMQKAKKRAENIVDNENLEHSEKIREMKKIYKKAVLKEKKELTYQVVTKGKRGAMSRPNGLYKAVDGRMKKDNRKQKATNRAKSWKAKSTKEKKMAQEKKRKHASQMKAGRTASRRMKRGKPV